MGTVHNDPDLQSGRSWENGDQSESSVYVTGLLAMRPSKQYHAGDEDLSMLEMQVGDTSRSKWREKNRTEGPGRSLGEQARIRLRRTLNLPGGRPGIPRHNAAAFGGGRMSINCKSTNILMTQ